MPGLVFLLAAAMLAFAVPGLARATEPPSAESPSATPAAPLLPAATGLSMSTGLPTATADVPAPAPVVAPPAAAAPAPPALFYFFSPDWRPPDLGRLAGAVENVLARGDTPVSFQAFTRYEDFERQLAEKAPSFLLAPAWVGAPSGRYSSLGLRVIARPVRRGKSSYRKALMTRPGVDSIDDLARGSIAATLHSMGDTAAASVLEIFHLDAKSARLVPVPKDVDALLALSFGQVDGALVTSEQYDQLALSNPAEAAKLHVLAFLPEVPLPPVFASAGADAATAERLRERLLRLADDPDGAAVLALLGFDGFVAEAAPPPPAAAATPGEASKPAATAAQASRPAAPSGKRPSSPKSPAPGRPAGRR